GFAAHVGYPRAGRPRGLAARVRGSHRYRRFVAWVVFFRVRGLSRFCGFHRHRRFAARVIFSRVRGLCRFVGQAGFSGAGRFRVGGSSGFCRDAAARTRPPRPGAALPPFPGHRDPRQRHRVLPRRRAARCRPA
ncbi:hypothetical protein C1I98_35210, partial [Spongiactinospora gelatinilytica]